MRTLYEGIYAIQPPKHIQRIILARGGRNIYGEPNYRFVRAEGRKRISGGKWFDWDPSLSMNQRNEGKNRPVRSVVEMRHMSMYPGEHGWVLERWMPPETYGTVELWNLPHTSGGTIKFIDGIRIAGAGEFPARGDYEHAGWVFPSHGLTEENVATAIGFIEDAIAKVPQHHQTRLLLELARQEEEDRERELQADKRNDEILGEIDMGFDARTPGGQAELHKFAEQHGVRSHLF